MFFSILLLDTALPSTQKTLGLIMMEVSNFNILETFLESAPQLILQSSIIVRTGNICEFTKFPSFWRDEYLAIGKAFCSTSLPLAEY